MSSTTFEAAAYTTGADFIGWDLMETPLPVTCDVGGAYTTSLVTTSTSTSWWYGTCSYASTDTVMGTTCDSNTVWYEDDSYLDCGSDASCLALTIHPTDHGSDSTATWMYDCFATDWPTQSIVHSLPPQYESKTVAPSTVQRTVNGAAASNGRTPTPTSSSSSSNSGSDSSGLSGGAVGGIVVGCVAGVAFLILLIFRKKIMACFSHGKPHGSDWAPVPPQTESVANTDNSTSQPSEMPSEQNAIHEIGQPKQGPVHEIGSSNNGPQEEKVIHELG